jgi:plasmid stabilization system protein ParE
MTIVVSPKARDDLREAFDYIQSDNPEAADRMLARIVEVIGMLASGIVQGREVVLRNGKRIHTWPVPPFRIYYRKSEQELQVIRVYHQARRPIER